MTRPKPVATIVVAPTAGNADAFAAAIERVGRLSARVLRLDLDGPVLDDPRAWKLIAESDVVYLPGARPGDVARLRSLAGVPVVDWRDTTATVLTAQVLTTLSRLGRPQRFTRVVIAGADAMPVLGPLLAAAGIRDLTMWNRHDADSFPLHDVAADAHVVIDLFGLWSWTGPAESAPVVIAADVDTDSLVALPGLLSAMAGTPGALPRVDVLHACVLALVMATGADHHLPRVPAAELADRIADAATDALRSGTSSRGSTR